MQLAIIIPFFKKNYFRECLQSLANQTYKNFNIYIGNDASLDDPEQIIDDFKDILNITYKRFDKNLGGISLTKQWERCIELSENERWIMILGDDDYLSKDYVEKFFKHLSEIEEQDIKVVHFASKIVRSPSGEISDLYTHPKIEKSTDFFYRKFLEFSRGSLTEQIFRRDAYEKFGFRDFPLGWGADNFAWLDFTQFGTIYSINSATAFFRISDANISRGGYKENLKQETKYQYFKLVIEEYLDRFEINQRLPLLLFYEQVVYNSNQNSLGYYIKMNKFLFKERAYLQLVKFLRRFIISHIK